MADYLEEEVYYTIESGDKSDSQAASCLAVAGSGLPSSYYYTNFPMKFRCTTDGVVYAQVMQDSEYNNQASYYGKYHLTNSNEGGSIWRGGLAIAKTRDELVKNITSKAAGEEFFSQGYGLGTWNQYTPQQTTSGDYPHSWWHFKNEMRDSDSVNDCYITDLNFLQTEIGNIGDIENYDLWVCGITLFDSEITEAITTAPYQITVTGLEVFAQYFPWAILKNNVWESANRSGGSHRMLKSSVWRDDKNSVSETAEQTVHQLRSGSWKRCDKIGANG